MTSFANVLKVSALVASLAAVPALAEEAAANGTSYTHEVLTRVADHAVYPRVAMANSEEGVVTVAVSLDTKGNLTGVNVLNSSGIPSIDLAAIQAAKDAAPYPAPSAANAVVKGKIRFAL
jgi:TonB family protein